MKTKVVPHIITLMVALVLGYIYYSPALEGKVIFATDQQTATGGSQELKEHYNKTGEVALWTNSMFGGMPAYTLWLKRGVNPIVVIKRVVEHIGAYPVSIFVLSLLGAYICLLLYGASPWVSLAGAIMYSFVTHFFVLVGAGHVTKILSICYMAPLLGALAYTFRKGTLLSGTLFTFLLTLIIANSHPQMVYYTAIAALIISLFEFVHAIKSQTILLFIKRSAILLVGAVLALGVNASYLMITNEYTAYSTRGENAIATANGSEKGLSADYILDYSYDITEAITAYIPRLKGGSNAEPVSENSEFFKLLEQNQGKKAARDMVKALPMYWGSQPIVGGVFYFGAVLFYLFVFGLFYVKGKEKWALATIVFVTFLFSLGKYAPVLSYWLIDHFPMYSKFRDVKNIVFVQAVAMWLLGMLAVVKLSKANLPETKAEIFKSLKWSLYMAGGIAALFLIFPSLAGNFQSEGDARLLASGWPQQFIDALISDRQSMARTDAFRSLAFVILTSALVWVYVAGKLKPLAILAIGSALVIIDMWPVNKRYLNNDNFVSKKNAEATFVKSPADEFILRDTDPNYRVLNISRGVFSDASTSYLHKSLGGYSGAKMGRYQDLIEVCLTPEMQKMISGLQKARSQSAMDSVLMDLPALNMLNTKYIIYNPKAMPIVNSQAYGNAWFADSIHWVDTPQHEIAAIGTTPLRNTAIINNEFAAIAGDVKTSPTDSASQVILTSYAPDRLSYKATSYSEKSLIVFSEIYYPKGWKAYIDGQLAEHFRANYLLRAMVIPRGEHEIVFEFKPETFYLGNRITTASAWLLTGLILLVLITEGRKLWRTATK